MPSSVEAAASLKDSKRQAPKGSDPESDSALGSVAHLTETSRQSDRRDVAEFWIQMGDRFVNISSLAVRRDEGEYPGTPGVTQDIAPLRNLGGERRYATFAPHHLRSESRGGFSG